MSLTGLTLVKNGNDLHYPWKECIRELASYCNEVLVATAISKDNTLEELKALCLELGNVRFFMTNWKDNNTGNGKVLADVINELLPHVKTKWCMYLQSDEFLDKTDLSGLKNLTLNLDNTDYSEVELYRTYFYGSVKTRLLKDEIWLGRLFKIGTCIVGGDGMHLVRQKGRAYRSNLIILHYSRCDSEEQLDKKIKNLDSLFHEPDEIKKFPAFKFNKNIQLINYYGYHPPGIIDFYSENK
jgi:hypothetical protein